MRSIGVIIGVIFSVSTIAQPLSYFLTTPEPGRTVHYQLDNLPESVILQPTGERQSWNFVDLKAPVVHAYAYLSADQGRYFHLFPGANLVMMDPWGVERYYRSTPTNVFLISEVLPVEKSNEVPVIKYYEDPLRVWSSLQNPGSLDRYVGHWYVDFGREQITDPELQKYDLVRVEVEEQMTEEVDARGVIYLPETITDVYRVRRSRESIVNISGKFEDSWELLPSSALQSIPLDVDLAASDYLFYDKNSRDVIAQVEIKNNRVHSVLFKSDADASKMFRNDGKPDFILYPSTTFGQIRLDFISFVQGTYNLEITNIIGKKIWSSTYYVQENRTMKEDLSFLPKGTYLYSLYDKDRNKLFTRRIAIIKP
jgi:hypothetical protein